MGKKPPPETPEEKAARKQAEAARFGQGNQLESLVEAAGCSCKGLRLRDAIKAAIVGEVPEFFEKDEERLARPVRAQLPAWDPRDKTRRMLDDYSEIVSELRREEINQDRVAREQFHADVHAVVAREKASREATHKALYDTLAVETRRH